MAGAPPTLFDEVSARLPLFDDLPDGTVDRLAAGGFGRGLLTAALRGRLRKGGFADMGALALASPADLMAVRKVGPVRVGAIRTHVLDELARLVPGARADHGRKVTDRRRLDGLRAVTIGWPLPGGACEERCGVTWADLALMPRVGAAQALGLSTVDLGGFVSALVRALLADQLRAVPASADREGDPEQETEGRAQLMRDRDREWDEAAPTR